MLKKNVGFLFRFFEITVGFDHQEIPPLSITDHGQVINLNEVFFLGGGFFDTAGYVHFSEVLCNVAFCILSSL